MEINTSITTNNFKDRKFTLLLYPDNLEHRTALKIIKHKYKNYACILHNEDKDQNGEVKKAHYHIVISLGSKQSPIWRNSLANDLSIEPNYIQQIKKLDNMLLYLIHHGEKDKHQYDIDEVDGPLKNRILTLINNQDTTESQNIIKIITYIEEHDNYLSLKNLSLWVASEELWSTFRRSSLIFVKLLDEKNKKYYKYDNRV